jgi:hypothetical protein
LRSSRPYFLIAGLVGCACAAGPSQRVESVSAAGALFNLRYSPEDAQVARQVERALDRAVHAAERWGELSAPVLITIHPTHRSLEAAAHHEDAWMRAWARHSSVDLQSPRSWSSGAASDAQIVELLSHELTHCVMFQVVESDGQPSPSVPMWFREGMATTAAGQAYEWVSASAIRRLYEESSLPGDPPTDGAAAASGAPNPDLLYAAAHRSFEWLLHRFGDAPVRQLLVGMGAGKRFGEAFRGATGISVQEFEGEFKERVLGLPMQLAPERDAQRVTVTWARPRPPLPPLLQGPGSTR